MIVSFEAVQLKMSYSITFGEVIESHAGMEKTGELAEEGFSIELLEQIAKENPWDSELVYLHENLPEENRSGNEAAVLILRSGLELLEVTQEELQGEMESLTPDKKAVFRGQVKNKLARWNLCMADFSQEADYAAGKGTMVNFADLDILSRVRKRLPSVFGKDSEGLFAELNVYYDLNKCGIGFHGDTERNRVICIRLGQSHPIDFQWFHRARPIGDRISLMLNSGDMYIMSQKAVGGDWKRTSQYTLRHAAGSPKYRKTKYD